jgi:hypothetical protein
LFAKTKIFAKTFAKAKIFAKRKVSEFSLIFAFRENEKRGFRFNPNLADNFSQEMATLDDLPHLSVLSPGEGFLSCQHVQPLTVGPHTVQPGHTRNKLNFPQANLAAP